MDIKIKIKDENIKRRLRELIKSRSKNATALARQMGVNPPYFVSMLNSPEKGISATIYKALLKINVNINWLINGKGNMSLLDDSDEFPHSWKDRALTAEETVKGYERDINNLNFLIKNLERMIQER